jgi:hypothetical protein
MPSLPTIARIARSLVSGGLITGVARSPLIREVGRRTITDPGGLLREVADPAKARVLLGRAGRDPGLREVAQVSLILLPFRYVPLGYAAMWVGRKVLGHRDRR